ncbi:MAG: succinylglutamate-semialdehyde dehydrogenase [Gammaproteobacteria bacterium]
MTTFSSTNPANGNILWTGEEATAEQVNAAVSRAKKAFQTFSLTSLEERIAYLKAFEKKMIEKQDELADAISQEMGKPRWEALLEVKTAISKIDISIHAYHDRTPLREAAIKDGFIVTRHHPQGVMGVMSPFNFPIHLAHGHIVPAILAGNTIVLKPSEQVPMCAAYYVRYWHEIGLPEGVIECVQGGPTVGTALVAHPDLRGLLFTGSEAVGKKIHAQFAGHPEKILALELGGNNPLVILDAPNVQGALNVMLQSAYVTSGQRCTCTRRLIVKRTPENEKLIEALIKAIPQLHVGDPANTPEPFMGPLVSNAAADKIMAAESMLIKAGGKSLVKMLRPIEGKAFVTPALIDCTGLDLPDEEYFGPLLKLYWVQDEIEAIALANATRYGLSAAVVCQDKALFDYCYSRMHAGLVHWNRPTNGSVSDAPFGGVGMSGNYRPTAYYAADYCAHPVVSMQSTPESMSVQPLPGMIL